MPCDGPDRAFYSLLYQMKVRCIDVYGQSVRPTASTLLRYQQLRNRNKFRRYYLEAVPRLVASVIFSFLWDDVPSSLKRN